VKQAEAQLPPVEFQSEGGAIDVEKILDLVSQQWVGDALARTYPGVVVEHMAVQRIVAGNATKIWIELEYNPAGKALSLPPTMVVKAGFDRHDPEMLFTYQAEMLTYRDVLPRFPLTAPACHYAGKGPGGLSAAIIMEDLSVRPIRFCHASQPLTRDEASAFVEAIARRHAESWNHPSLFDGTWHWPTESAETVALFGDYFLNLQSAPVWSHYVGLPRCQAISNRFHDRARFVGAMGSLGTLNEAEPRVVMIGDTHLSNLYIEEGGRPGFLDFLGRVGCWAEEISFFLCAGLDMQDRRSWERDLLREYLDTLAANGVTPPAFEQAWVTYGNNLLFGLFVWMTNGELFQTEAVNAANAARFAAAAIDHGVLERLAPSSPA
jgi:hypothetical protein